MKIKPLFLTVFLLVLALALAACSSAPAEPEGPTGDPVAGESKYTGTCVSCHGPDAKGLPNLGKDLTTSEWTRSKSDAELVEFLKVGRSISDPLNTTQVDMPPRGGNPALTDTDLLNIVAYLRTLEE